MEAIRFGEMHPLDNPLVLDIICKDLSIKDLQNLRLVSKSLDKSISKLWRSSVILKIDSNATLNETVGLSMADFLKFVENDSDEYLKSPFTSVVLHEQSQRFWNLCGSSIKHLEIRQYNILDDDNDEMGHKQSDEDIIFLGSPSLTFLKHATALQKLILAKGCSHAIRQTDSSTITNVSLAKCNELIILEDDVLEVNDLKKLMGWLPHIKILKMVLGNDTFSLVCERWTNLKSLEVMGLGLDDVGLTGLSENDVTRINKERESDVLMTALTRRANITCLKHLENIMISGVDHDRCHLLYRPFFDHCAAVCGFLQLPAVKIQFQNCLLDNRYLLQYGTACNQISRTHFLYGSIGYTLRKFYAHVASFSLSQQEKNRLTEQIKQMQEVLNSQ